MGDCVRDTLLVLSGSTTKRSQFWQIFFSHLGKTETKFLNVSAISKWHSLLWMDTVIWVRSLLQDFLKIVKAPVLCLIPS